MTLDDLIVWHTKKAERLAQLAGNARASTATAGELHRKRQELRRQFEFHQSAVAVLEGAVALRVRVMVEDTAEDHLADHIRACGGEVPHGVNITFE